LVREAPNVIGESVEARHRTSLGRLSEQLFAGIIKRAHDGLHGRPKASRPFSRRRPGACDAA
jgi:hypothetical protein